MDVGTQRTTRRRVLSATVAALCVLSGSVVSQSAGAATCDGPSVERVTMKAADGVKVAGFVQGRGIVGVVLVHQVNGDHCGWAEEAAFLARRALVLSVDLRGYGASGRATGAKALLYRNDIAASVTELRRRGAERIVLVGASMGGSAVVVAASVISPPVDAVVAVSAPANFKGQNASAAAAKLSMAVRFVAARDDGRAAATATALVERATASADAKAELYDKGGHGWALLRPTHEAQGIVDNFLDALV
jgi:pimeloyl-ACP methyl ester carboxylesterase